MKNENRLAPKTMTNSTPQVTDRVLDRAQQRSRSVSRRPSDAEQDGAEGADRGRLGRAEHAGIDAADGDQEQRDELPGLAHRGEPLAPAAALSPAGA